VPGARTPASPRTTTSGLARTAERLRVEDPGDRARAADALAGGAVVGVVFGNIYALVSRPDRASVAALNVRKGRPADQVGSLTTVRGAVTTAWDLDRLPAGLDRAAVHGLVSALLDLGPFGFRGPARAAVPDHLSTDDAGVRTAQVITPGSGCPSEDFLDRALTATGGDWLYVTSANRSRHLTGAEDSPAHWRAAGLWAEFGGEPGFVLLEHDDEDHVASRYRHLAPTSTSVLALQRVVHPVTSTRPHLVLERHGSLPAEVVREVLDGFGFGLVLAPAAGRRLAARRYADAPADGTVSPATSRSDPPSAGPATSGTPPRGGR